MEVCVKTSSPPDVSPPSHHCSVSSSRNSSCNASLGSCFTSAPGSSIFTAFTVVNIVLLLPLSIFILSFGFQRWRKQRGSVTANPTDIFTYHMVTMEMIGICASISCSCGALTVNEKMAWVGCNMFAIISCVKMFFHVLTCIERYLAVVHPITYMGLSKRCRAMIRNVSAGSVWFLCTGLLTLRFLLNDNFNLKLFFFNLVFSLVIMVFCSLSVLCVLKRPGPGDGGEKNGKGDKSKQRAFVTIMAIMVVLFIRFAGNLVCQTLKLSPLISHTVGCAVQVSGIWFCLPSSYVLPLLFLHRAEKLLCFKHNTKSG